jgi:membrane-bound inhibitor of C-type lysozyme
MTRRKGILIISAVLFVMGVGTNASPAAAQTFRSYTCADGTQFIAGFFQYDKRAHLQIGGKAVALGKRLALSGSRYTGGGITLKIAKAGTTLKVGKRPVTVCSVQ